MTSIVVARHGNTFEAGEAPRRIGRRTDIDLTDTGRRQAAALGETLRASGWSPDVVLSGPLVRARRSAALMAAAWTSDPAVQTHSWLDEIDHGPDEGHPEHEVAHRIGTDALQAWDRDGIAPAKWTVDAAWRIAQWRDVLADHVATPRSSLCVTSNGAARFALLAVGPSMVPAPLTLRTGACGAIGWSGGAWHVLFWNWRPGEPGFAPIS